MESAKKGDDRKTALAALREARDGLQLLMRVAGMLAADGSTNIDARQQTVQIFAKISDAELKALAYGTPISPRSEAVEARETIDATEESAAADDASQAP